MLLSTSTCAATTREEHEQAVRWFTMGAEAGFPSAMFRLAKILDAGDGAAEPDSTAAVSWYKRAAEAGHVGAACFLGQATL